jgi:hypothetical protein
MPTQIIGNGGINHEVTRHGQDDTFILVNNSTLDLLNAGGTAAIKNGDAEPFLGSGPPPAIGQETVNLRSNHGHNTIDTSGANGLGAGSVSGTVNLRNHSTLVVNPGPTHASWINTGLSIIDGGSSASFGNIGNVNGGSFLVEHGSTLQAIGAVGFSGNAPVVLAHGGTFIVSSSASDVTFQSQTHQERDAINMKDVFNAASFSYKDDFLQVFNAAGNQIGAATLHNLTKQPVQVDQTNHGVVVIADATPRPGIIVGPVA